MSEVFAHLGLRFGGLMTTANDIIQELGVLIRAAGADEAGLAGVRANFDQLFAEYQDSGLPRDQAVAFTTIMLLLAAMRADPRGALGDAMGVFAGSNPRLPLLTLAVVVEALK